jgi:Uma2 family endonuclease
MSPSPSSVHQTVSFNLGLFLGNYLFRKPCKVFTAPSDVRLPKQKDELTDKQIYTVVQPDIYVVCDRTKIDKRGCIGAPDLIIEIVSPKNAKRDVIDKKKLYEEHGVREYWIVYPHDKIVYVYLLDEHQKYQLVGTYADDDKVKVNIFEDLYIDLFDVFED